MLSIWQACVHRECAARGKIQGQGRASASPLSKTWRLTHGGIGPTTLENGSSTQIVLQYPLVRAV